MTPTYTWRTELRRPFRWLRVQLYRPRGWVKELLEGRPNIAARDVLDDLGDLEPNELSATEQAAVECANYVIEIGAAHWDHMIVHPVRRRRRTKRKARRP